MRIPLVGGDPDLVRALIDLLGEFRSAVDERYRPVDRGVRELSSGWSGEAAERFFDRMQDQRPQVDAIAGDITTINDALSRFVADLEAVASAVAEVRRQAEQLSDVQRALAVRRLPDWLLNDEALQVRAMVEQVRADADAARAMLEERLRGLAFFGQHGPDGVDGAGIGADEWATDVRGRPWRARGRGEVDWAGDLILGHWLYGGGEPIVVNNDPAWSDYMTDNHIIHRNAALLIEQEARNAIAALPAGGDQSVALDRIPLAIQNGYGTGYELLHGTNVEERGGFEVTGTQTVTPLPDGGHEVRVVADYTWHDRQDPNLDYPLDGTFAEAGEQLTGGGAADYDIDITWTRESVLRFDAHGQLDYGASYGWPTGYPAGTRGGPQP
jgi:uncharacterized protein YukE